MTFYETMAINHRILAREYHAKLHVSILQMSKKYLIDYKTANIY